MQPHPSPPPRRRPDLARIEELAARALTAPRALTPQVLQHLLAREEVTGDKVESWLREHLSSLEGYELDLLLSPLFTPGFEDRLQFETVLEECWLEPAELEALLVRLMGRRLPLSLLHEGETIEVPFPAVILERYLRLLHLDGELPVELLAPFAPLDPTVRCVLRDGVWRRPPARKLLPVLLQAARSLGEDFPGQVRFLTDFVRTYRPASRQECLDFLQNLAQACEVDLQHHRSGLRSFFDEELKGSYGGTRKVSDEIVAEHESMIARARSLHDAIRRE